VTRSLSLEKRRAHGATYVPNFLFWTRVLLPSIQCSINVIISWRLDNLQKEMGAPEVLVCDPHPTQTQQKVKEFCTQIGTTLRRTQWANCAELYVGLIKEATQKDMQAKGSPLVLWDYCMERRALIFQITAKSCFS
jgi:hypothetical protein